jgi:hypothetical protein
LYAIYKILKTKILKFEVLEILACRRCSSRYGWTGVNQINLNEVYPNGGVVIEPLLVNIDPVSGTATIPKVTYGRYGGGSSTQHIAKGAGDNDVAGYVFSCTGFITLSINQSDNGGGDYGPNKLILQKQ